MIDRDSKATNDRTWCFWSNVNFPIDDIVTKQWNKVYFKGEQGVFGGQLGRQGYRLVRSADFYQKIKQNLALNPYIHWKNATILDLEEKDGQSFVHTDKGSFSASYIFNSCYQKSEQEPDYHHLLQHFKGWFIQTEKPVFNSEEMVLMDFRIAQNGVAKFMYILPFSKTEALVEYTLFSESLESPSNYNNVLENYITEFLGAQAYTVLEEEFGVIPMTDQPFQSNISPNILNIGTLSGAVKPTTGYAFTRILQQTEQIVKQLEKGGPINTSIKTKSRLKFYDKLLLNILQHEGGEAHKIFNHLFKHNNLNLILRFLEEKSSLWQEMKIFSTLPAWPFLKAIYRTQFKKSKNGVSVPATI